MANIGPTLSKYTGAAELSGLLESDKFSIVSVKTYGAVGDGITDDAIAIQNAINAAGNSGGGIVYFPNGSYNVTKTLSIITNDIKILGNNATVVASYEQSASPSYIESLFYVNSADNVFFENIKLQYTGTYNVNNSDYDGYISGIHIENSDNFTAKNIEVYGFNRAGINIATLTSNSTYCKSPKIINCFIHDNRVSGVIFGNVDNGIVSGCTLSFNGISSSVGTGYGFSGWSNNICRNTIIDGNQAVDNYRKGIDFHAGENGLISNNVCARNKIYGIYVMGTIGSWIINNNTVTDMTWDNSFPAVSPYGIRVGALIGQGLTEIPTSYVIDGNVISKMTKTAGSMFPLGDSMVGCSYGKLVISNNIIDVGVVSMIHQGAAAVTGTQGNYYDIQFIGNQFAASEVDSTLPPFSIRGSNNRQKTFNDNTVNISTVSTTAGIFSYDSSSISNRCFISIGNTVNVPISSWSAIYDPIFVRRTTNEKASNNIINGAAWRDWDGYKFIDGGTVIPTTNLWTQGSIVTKTNAAAGGDIGWVCVTQGEPGTWKSFGTISV